MHLLATFDTGGGNVSFFSYSLLDHFCVRKLLGSIHLQIVMKQQQRLIRMEEHKRRLEEAVRNRGEYGRGGGGGGGPYRRRYD